jgi:hypothetical protein
MQTLSVRATVDRIIRHPSGRTRRHRMQIRTAALALGAATLLAVGAIALAVGVTAPQGPDTAGVANAQFLADISTPALDASSGSGWDGGRRGPGGMGGRGMHDGVGPLRALVDDKTITADQATKIVDAFRTAVPTPTQGTRPDAATLKTALKTALDQLVAANPITSAQATRVTTAFGDFATGMGRGGCGGFGGRGGFGPGPNAPTAPNAAPNATPNASGTGTSL